MRRESQQNFALLPFDLLRRRVLADTPGRPLTEKRYSPFVPPLA